MSASEFQKIPSELRQLPQWVCWKLETVDGRLTKVPYTPSNLKASTTDPQSWATFDACVQANSGGEFSGIGFVFAKGGNLRACLKTHEWGARRASMSRIMTRYTMVSPVCAWRS